MSIDLHEALTCDGLEQRHRHLIGMVATDAEVVVALMVGVRAGPRRAKQVLVHVQQRRLR
jgi:hypothetical protein